MYGFEVIGTAFYGAVCKTGKQRDECNLSEVMGCFGWRGER